MSVIGNAYDAARAQKSSEYAFSCWYNYTYEDNTLGISDDEINALREKWNKNIAHWVSVASQDHTEYKLDDEDWDVSWQEGWDDAADESGHDGDTTRNNVNNAGNIDLSAGGAAAGAITNVATQVALKAAEEAAKKAAEEVAKKTAEATAAKIAETLAQSAAEKAAAIAAEEGTKTALREGVSMASSKATEAALAKSAADNASQLASQKATELASAQAAEQSANETVKKASKFAGWMLTAPLSLAAGVLYMATRPNKKEHEALQNLAQQIIEAQQTISAQEVKLEEKEAEITETSEQATENSEENNQEINNKQADYVKNMAAYKVLMSRVASGERTKESDKALLKGTARNLQDAGAEIVALSDKSQDEIQTASEEISSQQGEYDSVAETLANIQGLTDLCESYDQATRTLCIVEAASQSLNVVSGIEASVEAGIAAAASMGFNVYAVACVAMGATGAGLSGAGVVEQSKFAIDIKDVIDTRKTGQSMLEHANGYYEGSIDKFAAHLENVDSLETAEVNGDIKDGNVPEAVIPETTKNEEDDTNGKNKKTNKNGFTFGALTGNNSEGTQKKKNPFM